MNPEFIKSVNIPKVMLKTWLYCLGASGITGGIMMASTDHFISSDVSPFLFWTLFFSVGLASVSPLVARLFSRLPTLLTYGLAVILGVMSGFMFTWCLYSTIINPYFGTFSSPVVLAWIVGGVSGFIALGGISSSGRRMNISVEVFVIVALCLGVGIGSNKLLLNITQERRVDTLWIRWYPSEAAVVLDIRFNEFLHQSDQFRLQRLHPNGYLDLLRGNTEFTIDDIDDSRQRSRLMIIMQKQITDPVELRLPADENIILIYTQDEEVWRMDPPDAALLEQSLHLEVDPNHPNQTIASYKVPGGTVSFTAIDWDFPTPSFEQ